MQNNSNTATPVNVAGLDPSFPALPVDATLIAPLPLPVVVVPGLYPVQRQRWSGGQLFAGAVISNVPCELVCVLGYNGNPTLTDLWFVQLHDQPSFVVPGEVPEIVIPVYGGHTPYSLALPFVFGLGLAIMLSTTELVYTAPTVPLNPSGQPEWLAFTCVYRTAT